MHKQFLAYVDGKSFLHKLDPRTKIITLMILSIIIFNTNRMWSLISLLLLFIAVSMVARISVKKLLLSVKPMLFFIGIVFLLHFLFAPAPVFSDVTMSVKLMDDQLNQWDDRFNPAKEYAPYTPVRLQYFENYPYLEEPENAGESCYVIITRPMPSNLSTTEMQNVYFEAGHFRIEKIPFDQIPEEKLHEFSIESVPAEPDPSKRVYFGEPAVYQIKVTPEKSFSIYPSTYSFMTGLGVALKFILLILFASLMAATTKQSALIQGIERLIRPIPLKWANMTSHDLALMVFLTIRFIPLLTSTAYQIKVSSQSRAFKPSKSPLRAIKIISTSLINSIINFADDVSRAMLNRGYTGVGKTSMNELKFKQRDGVFFCSFILLMLSIIMFVGWLQLSLGVGV
ncbi:energy-coupling factor transporter transmembrane component T family protein [Methanimicrococcus blatticola]|uniref:Cobalt transport protein n=1 Tax=Methanimicrococcus blatticola TaxID=91560 RepID=A0A484F2K5_9EURY|nr:energy-coupling factor transporter transmembrane component T [Methanimicrococcus blatticola]MBZ3935363.1 energy-coupling factor transporter transmembrane protein EcfT [Methanimicrococcus blatticola]MCC2508539.1 energy-coupling factor transporter transmembrane protein EcfT [Methanimicrococcus blatticola]TDQ67845.1 cobalt transport protein [Methanimicrococcus blatticola]